MATRQILQRKNSKYLELASKQQAKQAKTRLGEECEYLKKRSIVFKTFWRALLRKKSAITVFPEGLQSEHSLPYKAVQVNVLRFSSEKNFRGLGQKAI